MPGLPKIGCAFKMLILEVSTPEPEQLHGAITNLPLDGLQELKVDAVNHDKPEIEGVKTFNRFVTS